VYFISLTSDIFNFKIFVYYIIK
jgi:hypothetical protein